MSEIRGRQVVHKLGDARLRYLDVVEYDATQRLIVAEHLVELFE